MVGADGAQSFVRRQAGIEASESDYGQSALVANFRCERNHARVSAPPCRRLLHAAMIVRLLPFGCARVSCEMQPRVDVGVRLRRVDGSRHRLQRVRRSGWGRGLPVDGNCI